MMKIMSTLIMLFATTFSVVFFLPQVGYSFWYGDPLPEVTDETTCEDLAVIAGQLNAEMSGFDNNPDGDSGVTISKAGMFWEGATLLSCVGGCTVGDTNYSALLVDTNGNFIQGWTELNAIPAKLLPDGYVMGGVGGGFGGNALVMQDWCSKEVWRWDVVGGTWHHDYNRKNSNSGEWTADPGQEPNTEAKALILANHDPSSDYDYDKSWLNEGHPAYSTDDVSNLYGLIDDAIYVVDKEGRIKWQWFASQHVDQMDFSTEARQAVNDICVGRGCRRGNSDWTHFNNVNWLGDNWMYNLGDTRFHPDNIIFDSRTSGMIGIIANDDEPGLWEKGDIVWQVGPGEHLEYQGKDIGPIIGPHNAHIIAAGLPGEGNVLVFDNGGNSCYGVLDYGPVTGCPPAYPTALRDFSRVLEINPLTKEVVWLYQNREGFTDEDGFWNRKFFSSFISSMQRTPIGTTLITEGNQARVFEVTQEGEIVWEFIPNAVAGGPGVIGRALYRAYRYPTSWLPANLECFDE